MSSTNAIQQRLALLKQQELDLRISFSQSQATLSEAQEIENKLAAVAMEIAELECDISRTVSPAILIT